MGYFKKIFFWFLFFVVFAAIPLILLEAGGRLFVYFKSGVPGKTYGLWRADDILGAKHKENAYNMNAETNDWGFRNTEDVLVPRPKDALRVIAYGGSTTFCYNLSNESAWPLQLQSILREKRNSGDQVLNGGAIMWSLGHAYARAKEEVPVLRPDYVIIYSGINEAANAAYLAAQDKSLEKMVSQGAYGTFATNYDQNRWSKRNLFTVKILDYVIRPLLARLANGEKISDKPSARSDLSPDPVILNNYVHVLKEFIDLVNDNGGQVIFVIQAQGNNSAKNLYLTSYSAAGASVAEKSGAVIVDARELVAMHEGDPMELFSDSGVHYSALGAKKLAQYIFEKALSPAGEQKNR